MNILSLKQYAKYAAPVVGVAVIVLSIVSAPLLNQQNTNAATNWRTLDTCQEEAAGHPEDDMYLANCINNQSVEGMVYRAYRVVLGREADRVGFTGTESGSWKGWVGVGSQAVAQGKNPTDVVVAGMTKTAEYHKLVGTGKPLKHYVEQVYLRAYGTTQDQAGINYWVNQINSGKVSYAKFLANVIQAPHTKSVWSLQAPCYITEYQLCAG